MPAYEDLKDASPSSIKKLNDMLRYLFRKIQGGITQTELDPGLAEDISSADGDKLEDNCITADKIGDGEIGTSHIQDAAITNAKICDLSADKINAGILDASLVTIQGSNGNLSILNNRLQVSDGSTERVVLGDVNGDGTVYGFKVLGSNGSTVLMDENGVRVDGVPEIPADKIGDGTLTKTIKLFVDDSDNDRQLWLGWLSDGYGFGYTEDAGSSFITRIDMGGFSSLTVTSMLNIMGQVTVGDNPNIDVYQNDVTIYVGQTRTANGTNIFNSFSVAVASLNKRLNSENIIINVDKGTYNESASITGFCGYGLITVNLEGGTNATDKVWFTGGLQIRGNSVNVSVLATAIQTNSTYMPVIRAESGSGMNIFRNCGAIVISGVNVKSSGVYHSVYQQLSSYVSYDTCCMEDAPSSSSRAGLRVDHGNAYIYNCKGSNPGYGIYIGAGGHVIRQGTVPNGTLGALQNFRGAYHDNGTITPTNSSGTVTVPGSQITMQFSAYRTRSYHAYSQLAGLCGFHTYSDTWKSNTLVSQGKFMLGEGANYDINENIYSGELYGTISFGSGAEAPTAISGRTLVSARIYLKRNVTDGNSTARQFTIYATTLTPADLAALSGGEHSPNGNVSGSGTLLGSLAWGEGKWFDIPVSLAAQAVAGKCLAIYSVGSNFAALYGIESPYKPLLEISYLP
jgi:hypothetical protein